jgi:4-amino-4-deoxy-L-arabinose transferase-like glycosyltransferase
MLGCLAAVLWSLAKLAAPRLGRIDPDLALLAVLGFGCAYSLSMSWPAFEAMVFPGAALLIALALEKGGPDRSTPWIRGAVVGLVLVLVTTAAARKHAVPFYWGRWVEPPLEASTVQPKAPELRGFLLSSVTAGFFDGVSETVKAHSRPEDRILVYPNMPILYALAQRLPATFALTHWVDVCPDFVAAADAQRLLSRPPAVIVLHPDLPVEIVTEERLFRNGERSDVREVLAALEALSQRYQVVGVYPVPGHPIPIQVWALRH